MTETAGPLRAVVLARRLASDVPAGAGLRERRDNCGLQSVAEWGSTSRAVSRPRCGTELLWVGCSPLRVGASPGRPIHEPARGLVPAQQHDGEQRTQRHNQPDNPALTAIGFLFHTTNYSVSTSMRRCKAVSTSFRSAATPPTLLITALKVRAS